MNRLGRAMADPTRSRILMSLLEGPSYPAVLSRSLDLSRSMLARDVSPSRLQAAKNEIQTALDNLQQSVDRVDAALEAHGGEWIMGERLTIADACYLPTIDRMDDLGLATQWAERPRLAAWYERIKARPAFTAAFYPGARLSELFGDAA